MQKFYDVIEAGISFIFFNFRYSACKILTEQLLGGFAEIETIFFWTVLKILSSEPSILVRPHARTHTFSADDFFFNVDHIYKQRKWRNLAIEF